MKKSPHVELSEPRVKFSKTKTCLFFNDIIQANAENPHILETGSRKRLFLANKLHLPAIINIVVHQFSI